jgi:plasmid stabilization system protein ParE
MSHAVGFSDEALEDLERIENWLIDQALAHGDVDLPGRALAAIRYELRILQTNPYTCRKAGVGGDERELVIPFGSSGFVALFAVLGPGEVVVAALRHQREDDYR